MSSAHCSDLRGTPHLLAIFLRLLLNIVLSGPMLSSPAWATSLPETYPMPEADLRPLPLDPGLAAWLDEHVEKPLATEMLPKDYEELMQRMDTVTRLYLDIARASHAGKLDDVQTAVTAAIRHLRDPEETQKNETRSHPLVPFLYEAILKVNNAPAEAHQLAQDGLNQNGAGSCAQRDILLADLTRDKILALSDEGLRDLIEKLAFFRSNQFRSTSFRKLISLLPETRREAVGAKLVTVLANTPTLLNRHEWLKNLARKLIANHDATFTQALPSRSPFVEPYASIAKARERAQKQRCATAKSELITAISKTSDKESLDEAMRAGKAIDSCFKARASDQRRQFWEAMLAPMEKAYGFAGRASVKLRIGYIYWIVNDFAKAKPLFELVRVDAAKEEQPEYEARATYLLGRLAEDEENRDRAIEMYTDYVDKFAKHENFEDSMQALVLMLVDKRDWKRAGDALERWIQNQSALATDDRSVSGMSFALFWAGRIKLELGDQPFATEYWRRAAAEYYSTYYGAISHYMLEKISGRILALQPSRTPAFRMTTLRQSFHAIDRQRVRRIEMLMRLGLRNKSECELEELGVEDRNPEKLLVKALMLHASGQWLESIKVYDSIPRSFRFSLPVGFERLVFPRRYSDTIYRYAAKANVDPDLVMAIIRQESVFNPIAKSPVGALGLMQLMPHTASVESARLSADYVTQEEKTLLREHAANLAGLLQPEPNLAIGIHHVKTLLAKYSSPVYVLSAYNASPSAAQRWMKTIPTQDVLAFIERIPYKETRAYVKLVLRNYFYYKRWYGPPTRELQHLDALTSPLLVSVTNKTANEAKPNH